MSTYTCESAFSTLSTIRRKQRNRLTGAHFESLTRINYNNYNLEERKYMKKVKEKRLQRARAPGGVALADDQGSALGAKDEMELGGQDIK